MERPARECNRSSLADKAYATRWHWATDHRGLVGKDHQGALVTLVDRKSKLTLIGKVNRYTADAVEETIISLMDFLPRRNYTLTVDNGKRVCKP